MEGLFSPTDIHNLENLLNPNGRPEDNSSDSEIENFTATIGKQQRKKKKHEPENPNFKVNIRKGTIQNEQDTQKNENKNLSSNDKWSIWSDDEIAELASTSSTNIDPTSSLDPRLTPSYDISYQQSVTSEDIYLQLGNKTPSSVSCEDMILSISLPDEQQEQIEVDLTDTHLDIRCVKYRLSLHLPHPVHSKMCKAQWDSEQCELKIILKLKREMDFINF